MAEYLDYLVGFGVGMLVMGVPLVVFIRRSGMYKFLWENEKAGNYIMTQRLSKLEYERADIEGDEE